jgi:hydroxymethylbilane synthase
LSEVLKIGTRGSALALYQARYVQGRLKDELGREAELVILQSQGDKDQSRPVTELGGVGVFVKELQRALLAREVDLAVHSLKDLPTEAAEGLCVAAYPIRVAAHELLIANPGSVDRSRGVIPLKRGAVVGTASERRRAQLRDLRPDLSVVGIRGNVPTRVDKARGEVDAVVLAAAGIDRLELALEGLERIDLPLDAFVPAPGQAALAIEVRSDDADLRSLLTKLDDADARETTEAERHLLHALGAGCSVPLGAYASRDDADLRLRATYEVGRDAEGFPHLREALVRASTPEAASALALQVLAPLPPKESLPDLSGKTVVVAREPHRAADLLLALEGAGAETHAWAPTRRASLQADELLRAALADMQAGGWALFASANAAAEFGALLRDHLDPLRAPAWRIGAVGPGTARALAEIDLPVDLLVASGGGAALAEALLARFGEARPAALLPAAKGGRAELQDALEAAGCSTRRVELYESQPNPAPEPAALRGDALVLASPSGARATLAGGLPDGVKIVTYGETTAAAVRELGHEVAAVAKAPTVTGVLAALSLAFGAGA